MNMAIVTAKVKTVSTVRINHCQSSLRLEVVPARPRPDVVLLDEGFAVDG